MHHMRTVPSPDRKAQKIDTSMPEFSEKNPTRRRWMKPLFLMVITAVVTVAIVESLHWWRHVDEPNAQVEADFTLLSSSVNATIKTVHVRRGERVEKGALLASMDTAVEGLDVETLKAEIAKEKANRDQIIAELAQYRREMKDKIATAEAAVSMRRREYAIWKNRHVIAQSNVERNKQLASRRAASKRQLDEAQDRLLDIVSKQRSLETSIQNHQKKLSELKNALEKEVVFAARIEAIDRVIDKIGVQLRQAQRRLSDMHIRSPIAGIIDEVYVTAGVYVEDGDRGFLLHDPNALWLEARIDESDIRHIASGQAVTIEFDAYPFEYYEGKVRSIGHATLGSMINGDNKAADPRSAQRVPVLIDLPKMDKATWPGMRASVNISVR
jgi:membrane fusion protein, multidrug efflux system